MTVRERTAGGPSEIKAAQPEETAIGVAQDPDRISITRNRRKIGHGLPTAGGKVGIEFQSEGVPANGPRELERGGIAQGLHGKKERDLNHVERVGVLKNVKDPGSSFQRPKLTAARVL